MSYTIHIRFYEELNDLLPRAMRKRETAVECKEKRSVKDLIESLGVPHTEVDLILVNGASVDFGHIVRDGDRVSVYPEFESLSIQHVARLRPAPLRVAKFVCDVHLGKLARRLRLLGFDTVYHRHAGDDELTQCALDEKRTILTCDRGLLKRRSVERGILIPHASVTDQTETVLARLDLRGVCKPFTRCTACNGLLRAMNAAGEDKARIETCVPPKVRAWRSEFFACAACDHIYWEGTHYEKLKEIALSHTTK